MHADGADYIGRRGVHPLQPEETTFCPTIPIIADNVNNEPDEDFRATCLIVNTTLEASGIVTIVDVSPPSE